MFKLFRALRSEHHKLWCKRSTFLMILLTALIAAGIFGASDRFLTEEDNSWFASNRFVAMLYGKEYPLPEPEEYEEPEPVFIDISPSDAVSGADLPVISRSRPEQTENDWRTAEKQRSEGAAQYWIELENRRVEGTPESIAILREQAAAERVIKTTEARLSADSEPADERAWILIQMAVWMVMPLAAAAAAVAASDMFAGEYTRGTIYMNLARPITRVKQYTAKLITAGLYAAMLLASAFFGALLTAVIKGGRLKNDLYFGYINGEVYQTTWMRQSLAVLGCCFAAVMICIAVCAAVGTLTHSRAASAVTALAVLCAGVYFGGAIAPTMKIVSGLSIFACLDLTAPLLECANYPTLTFADCLVSVCAHFFVLAVCGYGFMKKDINE